VWRVWIIVGAILALVAYVVLLGATVWRDG
jgi:hypothetical protein